MINELKQIQKLAQTAIDEANRKEPDRELINGLINFCMVIEESYQNFCNELDENWGDPGGTAYENGVSIEFQIEADWWHDISLILRKLQN